MSLIVLADLKTRLEITANNTNYDTVLGNLILAAEKFTARRLLKRTIIESPGEGEEITEYRDGDNGEVLYTREYPIISIEELLVDGSEVPARDTVTGTGYVIQNADLGVIKLVGYCFYEGVQNIELTYLPGWATVPDEIIEAAYRIASALWNQKGLVGIENQSIETLTQKITAIIDQTTRDLVAPFVRPQP